MWIYNQISGELTRDGVTVARGYSGAGAGKNNPAMETVRAVGPIPKGQWKIHAPYNSAKVGPFALPLYAADAKPGDDIHQPTGRSAFRIHGDSIRAPGTASNGCIVLSRAIREKIWKSGDHDLLVK